jgi:hypothetical protein
MYKYIIYCSISAVIIIAAKYVYQNWIKQNHTIATIKQDIQLLQTKVKNVEEHFEKTKGSMSGGVTIPIMFQKFENTPPPQQPQSSKQPQSPIQTKNIVELNNDLSSASSNFSSVSSSSRSSGSTVKTPNVINLSPAKSVKKENDNLSVSESSKSSSKRKVLDISDDVQIVKEVTEATSPKKAEAFKELEAETVTEEVAMDAPKKVIKKKALPDAKDFQNGDKHTDENNVEYLCIVGKRGGHSWKKINL